MSGNLEMTMPMHDLSGQVAVITGGTENLGYDIADVLASAGCSVIITSRRPERSGSAVERLQRKHAIDAIALPLDQSDFSSVQRFAVEANGWKGRIDILVNNAGSSGTGVGDFFQRDPAEIAAVIGLNLTGVIYCCKEIGRFMAERKKGKIINIASVSGMVGRSREIYRKSGKREQPVDYAASKAGVIGLTRDLAAYMAPYNIQVNAISPGLFLRGSVPADFVRDYAHMTPVGRVGRIGEDIKGAALFLASSASDYITGQNLAVDGGFTSVK